MRIIGIDPGIARTGWGIIEVQSSPARNAMQSVAGGKFKVQNFGCFETTSSMQTPERLVHIYSFLTRLFNRYKPDSLAIEELFFNTNAKSALVVGQARGVVMLAAAQKKIPIAVYTPLQVKIAVAGYGRAEKAQVGKMVKLQLGLLEVPKPDDTADALAIALTHAVTKRL